MKSRLKGSLILLAAAALAGLTPLAADGLRDGRASLDRATEGLFNQTLPSPALRDLLERSLRSFAQIPEPCQRDYWRARAAYLYGFVEQGAGRSKEAQRRFGEGYELAGKALRCSGFSDGYRLLADTQAQLLSFNGLLYKMEHGPRVRELAEKALALDPGNARARLTLALYYKKAPAIAGGNVETALRLLHQIERSGGLEPLDRFSVNVWLGIAYAEKENAALARRYLARAREIFPGNTWLRQISEEHSL